MIYSYLYLYICVCICVYVHRDLIAHMAPSHSCPGRRRIRRSSFSSTLSCCSRSCKMIGCKQLQKANIAWQMKARKKTGHVTSPTPKPFKQFISYISGELL